MSLVFLHGWGQSDQIWFEQRQHFPQAHYLNLSGDHLESLHQTTPAKGITLVGWSLGGMLAIQWALQYPKQIQSLVLVSCTPSFRQRRDWLHGCDDATFQGFCDGIHARANKTMSRFFALMFHGDGLERSRYNQIAHLAINKASPPSQQTLEQGLTELSEWDLRSQLAHITQPCLVLHGQQDAVIPIEAGQHLAAHIPEAQWQSFAGCGHAPFITHSQTFNQILESWCPTH